ncbi:protein YIPF3-like [Schistocerca nitens]|uniref:protein YIPF3-like n=1 Tax=Schistocerca nitens TaxID=7011 RepID=UPI002119B0A6|nr:protein YIPF3-like [Schistocerca nitens]
MLGFSFFLFLLMRPRRMQGSQEPCSVIYLGRDNLEKTHEKSLKEWLKTHLIVPPMELISRILHSLFPTSRLPPPDLLGPGLAFFILAALLHTGHSAKVLQTASSAPSPILAILLYTALIPAAAYVSVCIAGSTLSLMETISLMGYASYGHILAMGIPVLFHQEESEIFFFWCLTVFGGLSSLRIILVLLVSVRIPAARLVVCSLVATLHLLSLVFLHFVYMHTTFVYGGN